MLQNIGFTTRANGLATIVKAGNTKGSALLGAVVKVLGNGKSV